MNRTRDQQQQFSLINSAINFAKVFYQDSK